MIASPAITFGSRLRLRPRHSTAQHRADCGAPAFELQAQVEVVERQRAVALPMLRLGNRLAGRHGGADEVGNGAHMQIGSNAMDPGADDLLVRRKARADHFLPPQFRDNPATKITLTDIGTAARFNIPAAMGLLLLNAYRFK